MQYKLKGKEFTYAVTAGGSRESYFLYESENKTEELLLQSAKNYISVIQKSIPEYEEL